MPAGGTVVAEVNGRPLERGNRYGVEAGRYAILSIIDHGIGMDEEMVKHAIEPLFSTKGVGKGTGLGLSMVHGLAEQSGGRFVLESKVEKGTKATLVLPLYSGVAADRPEQRVIEALSSLVLSVLVVDDDVLVAMTCRALCRDGLFGQDALKIVEQRPFDLLVTDRGMPNMTGQLLIERLRAQFLASCHSFDGLCRDAAGSGG